MPQKLEAIVQRMIDAGESEDNIASVIRASKVQPQSDSGALGLAAVKPAATLATEIATNPGLPKATASAGRIIGAIAPVVEGGHAAGVGGAMAGGALAAKGSWLGGKAGYFTGKMAQDAAMPIAKGLGTVAQAASTLSGAQGVNDLAQMVEPGRRDIGFLGVGPSVDVPGAHPPVLNALLARIRASLGR